MCPGSPVVLEPLDEDAARERLEQIKDYHEARVQALAARDGGPPYRPLPPDRLYLPEAEWRERLNAAALARLTPFAVPDGQGRVVDAGTKQGHNFAAERAEAGRNVFEAVTKHVFALQSARKRVVVALWSEGARERMSHVLAEHGLNNLTAGRLLAGGAGPAAAAGRAWPCSGSKAGSRPPTPRWSASRTSSATAWCGRGARRGGRRISSRRRRASPPAISSCTSTTASAGSWGCAPSKPPARRTTASKSITPAATSCSCRSRTPNCSRATARKRTAVDLDRLGGGAWQARKARMKSRIREIANELIKVAAERQTREAPKLTVEHGPYDEFCAGFPYEETEDQQAAIDTTLNELASGRPMDRLICGDVGFGKTEVALRAAFVAAMNGKQVAVVVPTTLLARQHTKTFTERFRGFPIKIGQASRLVTGKELAAVKKGIADGSIDIVVGTHALLGKAIAFKDLGLLIVDEEQHFGVAHKEKLKQLRAEVHVLTLTATPIPRTLQLALSGVRDLSIIASPPVDRLAVRTFVSPFDPLVVREALLRERYRGGQCFYVCPRIEDLAGQKEFLERHVPEMKVTVAHGQMPSTVLDDIMSAFYDGKYDLLLSTTIVESGLDIPNANTLIVHRADRFGLSQLYQLRGRVGRSKVRAYALFTLPAERKITVQAEQRLKVLQSLDTLGAGFQLASHDLDLRGAGNLLGEEQSGHIKEVGFELYQQMLEEAVASLKAGITAPVADKWSPQITIGTPVMIPEDYVADLPVRLALYRRLAEIEDEREIESFGAEMADRFGPLPVEVEHLLQIVAIKALCRQANVEKIEAGPKGAVVTFRDNSFANPERLIKFIREEGARVRPGPEGRVHRRLGAGRRTGSPEPSRSSASSWNWRSRRRPRDARLVHHRERLDLDQLLGLAQLEHRDVGRGRHVLERREIRVDHLARPPMSPICGRARKTKMCTTSLNEAPAASSVSLMPSIVRRVCASRLGGKYFRMSSRRCGWS